MGCVPVKGKQHRKGNQYRTAFGGVGGEEHTTAQGAVDDEEEEEDVAEGRCRRLAGYLIKQYRRSRDVNTLGYTAFNTLLAELGVGINTPEEFAAACTEHGSDPTRGVGERHLAKLLHSSDVVFERAMQLLAHSREANDDDPSRTYHTTTTADQPTCPLCEGKVMTYRSSGAASLAFECSICDSFSISDAWVCSTDGCPSIYCTLCCPQAGRLAVSVGSSDSPRFSRATSSATNATPKLRWGRTSVLSNSFDFA